jgi:single-stranded DNA-binding protein
MEPQLLFTKQNHTPVVNLRVGTTPRRVDVNTGEWRDLPSSFFTVNCWRRLAYSVSASLHKGDPVIIRGRLKSRTWNDNGRVRTAVDIEAESVGHDMSYGWSHYMRGLHPSTEEMLAKMGMTETPYGIDGTASFDSGSAYSSNGAYSNNGAYSDSAAYSGTAAFSSNTAFSDNTAFSSNTAYSGNAYSASADSSDGNSFDDGASPRGPGEHIETATIETATIEAAQSETEDSAGVPDGELAAEEVPF